MATRVTYENEQMRLEFDVYSSDHIEVFLYSKGTDSLISTMDADKVEIQKGTTFTAFHCETKQSVVSFFMDDFMTVKHEKIEE